MIKVQNLRKVFRVHKREPGLTSSIRALFRREWIEKVAVSGSTFSVAEGEIVGLIGANGAGKTTLLKMLSGIIHPTSGEARVLGSIPWKRENSFRTQIAPALVLLFVPEGKQGSGEEGVVHRDGDPGGGAATIQLLENHAQSDVILFEAAEGLWRNQAEKPEFGEFVDVLPGEFLPLIVVIGVGDQDLVCKFPGGVPQLQLTPREFGEHHASFLARYE